jgi:uncharacterized protein (DUF983 family)
MADGKTSGGISLLGMLTILFIGLKLTHNIEWSWWWVLSPTWVPLAIILMIFMIMLVAFIVSELLW